ncbi:MAG: hypothetical protein JNL67_08215 [Planctomycetaceae bacterium]|nr:hypothetical protein [Planctomycetaceae bacterium]
MITKSYLALVGAIYLYLAIWCSLDPTTTSKAVGFELIGPSGQGEFLTVYGGLEFGLALVFLMPLLDPPSLRFSIASCTLVHGSLVAFRTISFLIYAAPERMTYQLAIGEWIIFLTSLGLWLSTRSRVSSKVAPLPE